MAAIEMIMEPSKVENITGKTLCELFLKNYPVLCVGRQTFKQGFCPTGEVITWCSQCGLEFNPGVEIIKLPCSHLFHCTCLAKFLSTTENLNCPSAGCKKEFNPYENLPPDVKCFVRVAYGVCELFDEGIVEYKPVAACIDEHWRFFDEAQTCRPYFPWGNRERYLENPESDNIDRQISPHFTLLEVKQGEESRLLQRLYPDSTAQNLRSNSPILSQLIYLDTLLQHLKRLQSERDAQTQIIDLLKLYLFADITNCIFVMEETFKHIYLQMWFGGSRLFWVGYREFEAYVLRTIAPLTQSVLSESTFTKYLQQYSEMASDTHKIYQLFEMVTILKNFDAKVDQLDSQWKKNPRIEMLFQKLEETKPYEGSVQE